MRSGIISRWLPVFVFFITFIVYIFISPYKHSSGDNIWYLPTTLSILNEGNTELNEYKEFIETYKPTSVLYYEDNYYNFFPIGTSILILPFTALIQLFIPDLYESSLSLPFLLEVQFALASLIGAGFATMVYLLARSKLSILPSLIIWGVFAFGTATWSIASRTLWMHGPSILMLSIAIYALSRAHKSRLSLAIVGFSIAFAYTIRSTNAIWVIIFSAYVLVTFKRGIWIYLVGAAVVAIPFLVNNISTYNSLLPSYFSASRLALHSESLEALLANFISPARGIFFYSPVLLFSAAGLLMKLRYKDWQRWDTFLVIGLALLIASLSNFRHWWGGASIGPRFMIEMLPFLSYFMIGFFQHFQKLNHPIRVASVISFIPLLAFSTFVHYTDATKPDALYWSRVPVNIDWMPERVWDWQDPSFLRPYRSFDEITPTARLKGFRLEFERMDYLLTYFGGWHEPETDSQNMRFMWMSQPQVEFYLPMNTEKDIPVSLKIAHSLSVETLDSLSLYVNNVEINLNKSAENSTLFTGVISQETLASRDTYTRFEIKIDKVQSPASLGIDADTRELGLAFDFMQIGYEDESLPRSPNLPR